MIEELWKDILHIERTEIKDGMIIIKLSNKDDISIPVSEFNNLSNSVENLNEQEKLYLSINCDLLKVNIESSKHLYL